MKSLLLAANKIVAPSEFLRDSFIRFGVPPDKIIFSDKGYDINRFNNLKKLPNRDKTRLIFGYVGGLLKYKGIDVIIDAFNRIKPEDADLRIYGDYDDKSRDFLNLRSRTRNQSIKFVGRYEDIKKPYSEIDVLIFPSICYENRPFVLTEAMISRIPTIASNIGSIPELIENGKNGLLFEAGNHEDLYTKLMIIINSPALLDNLKTASHSVKTIQSDAEETERIYHQALHNI
jgi:glycosyltransferase involved in cell wall biosynthesis